MATLNYATLYQEALDQPYKVGRKFDDLYRIGARELRWTGAKTVAIPNISTGGLTDTNRDVIGTFTRNVDNKWETKTLTHDREFRTLVDPMDIDETNMALTLANITSVFNREQKIPEFDKYMASKLLSEYKSFTGVPDATAINLTNVLDIFDGYMKALDENEVPEEGRICYVTPDVRESLKQAAGLTRFISVQEKNGEINRSVDMLDDVRITMVPSSRMKDSYDFTNGAVPAVGAKQINMILLHPSAVVAPEKYEFVSLQPPSAITGGKYVYFERLYFDVFLYAQKYQGVQFNVSAT